MALSLFPTAWNGVGGGWSGGGGAEKTAIVLVNNQLKTNIFKWHVQDLAIFEIVYS